MLTFRRNISLPHRDLVIKSTLAHDKKSEKEELRSLNAHVAQAVKEMIKLEKYCNQLQQEHLTASYQDFIKESEFFYAWLMDICIHLVKAFPKKTNCDKLKQAIDFCLIKTDGIWDGTLQKNIYLIDTLIQIWNNNADYCKSTKDPVSANYNKLVNELNNNPNKHHFKRLIGQLLSTIHYGNLAFSSKIASRMNIGLFDLNRDNKYKLPGYPKEKRPSNSSVTPKP